MGNLLCDAVATLLSEGDIQGASVVFSLGVFVTVVHAVHSKHDKN